MGSEVIFKTTPTSSAHQQIMFKPIKPKPQLSIDILVNETKPSLNKNTTKTKKEYHEISYRPICREKKYRLIIIRIILSITKYWLIMIGFTINIYVVLYYIGMLYYKFIL